ncbi:MAG: hypothetical protein WC473_02950 [Patescibacteria group bacterium]|jgi:hypothetical protein
MEKDNKITKGIKNINNYTIELLKSDEFNQMVLQLREKYQIPQTGLTTPNNYNSPFSLPVEWRLKGIGSENDNKTILVNVQDFCIKKGLGRSSLYAEVYFFIVYNKPITIRSWDLCILLDKMWLRRCKDKERIKERITKEEYEENDALEYLQDLEYPISIGISPYASQNEIVDFIKKNDEKIKELQKRHRRSNIKIGKFRDKDANTVKMYDYISSIQEKPRKEIAKLVNDKFKRDLGYQDISSIISLINKRKKEV